MGRDRAEGGAFVFDLVDGDADGGAGPDDLPGPDVRPDPDARPGPEDAPRPEDAPDGGSPARSGSALWWRRLAPVAAVVAVVLGTGYAVEGIGDAERIDRVRVVDGGVADLSSPLEELWAWDGGVGSSSYLQDMGEVQVAVLDGLLVLVSEGDLVALEPASGEQEWSVPLGVAPDCGPVGYPVWADVVTETVVCLQGADEDREVIAVGPDGVASRPRPLDAADTRRYGPARPGPDGTVLRARRVGPASAVDLGDAVCSQTGDCTGTVESGRDIHLRAEDAVTGAERWDVTAPFVTTPAADCQPWQGAVWGEGTDLEIDQSVLRPEAFTARIGPDLVDLYGCGAAASVTANGVLLRRGEVTGAGETVRLSTGGYAVATFDPETRTTIYSAEGEALRAVPAYVYAARLVDGSGMLLGWHEGARGPRAYEPDGTPRWDATRGSVSGYFAAEVGGTAVVLGDDGVVHALDTATGDELWARDLSEVTSDPHWGNWFFQAFTDGRHVVLLVQGEAEGIDLVSLDTLSGRIVWEQPLTDVVSLPESAVLVAVDGHLLAVTPTGVRRLG
jgi:outer membrane protein assembly factor BamB